MKPIKDDNILLNNVIDFLMYKKDCGATIELIVRPECNQKCEYCYLK